MTVLPIVERELRTGARNPLLYRGRFLVPLIGSIIFIVAVIALSEGVRSQTAGKSMLNFCFGLLFLICLFSGVQLTADAISREKREGTLGFLFLTDLKGYDIVLGKLVSSSIGAIYAMFGILPVVSLIFLLGGVEWTAVVRLTWSCVNVLFLSLSAGLLASVLSFQERKARGAAGALVVFSLVGGPLLGLLWLWVTGGLSSAGEKEWMVFQAASPLTLFAISFSSGGSWLAFAISSLLVLGIAAGMLALACWLAPRTWQDRGSTRGQSARLSLWRKLMYGKGVEMDTRRAAMLDINAVHWLTNRDRWAGRMVWALWGGIILAFMAGVIYFGVEALNPGTAVALVLILNAAMKLSMAGEACRWIARDRQSGVLELVLTTSLTVDDILEGQWVSLRKIYLKPFIATAIVEVVFALVCVSVHKFEAEALIATLLLLSATLASLVLDFKALGWTGMWKGLSAMPIEKARQQTISAVLAGPWFFFYAAMIPTACAIGMAAPMLLWPAIMFGASGWWINHARGRLREEFRVRAMERYSPVPKVPFFKKIGQTLDSFITPTTKTSE